MIFLPPAAIITANAATSRIGLSMAQTYAAANRLRELNKDGPHLHVYTASAGALAQYASEDALQTAPDRLG